MADEKSFNAMTFEELQVWMAAFARVLDDMDRRAQEVETQEGMLTSCRELLALMTQFDPLFQEVLDRATACTNRHK